MNGSPQRLIVADSAPQSSRIGSTDSVAGWSVLGLAGLLFFLVGMLDVVLVWIPLAFGNTEWEFGSVTATLNGLPAPTIGLALMAAAAVAKGEKGRARIIAAILSLIALFVVLVAVLYATDVPIGLRAVAANPTLALGLKKAIAKTSGQALIYPIVLFSIAVSIWRRVSRAAS